MNTSAVAAATLLLGAVAAAIHLEDLEENTIVVYTTPALRDVLEQHVLPGFERETGWNVEPVYLAAGAEYQRLRLSRTEPEADLFLHASPLLIEKGFDEGHFSPVHPAVLPTEPAFHGRRLGDNATTWAAFAWSPLVEVYAPRIDAPPDLLHDPHPFGFPHPRLSNNGVYGVLFYEAAPPAAGAVARENTRVQPTNARTNIGGVADGSFDVTLGYEAVTLFYQGRGADVRMAVPLLDGERVTLQVVFAVGLVRHHDHEGADELAAWLLSPGVQAGLPAWGFRSVTQPDLVPPGGVDLAGARVLPVDWSDWRRIEATLPAYEVG